MTTRARIGLVFSALWLIACMIALSGQCQRTPDAVRNDRLLTPSTPPSAVPRPEAPRDR